MYKIVEAGIVSDKMLGYHLVKDLYLQELCQDEMRQKKDKDTGLRVVNSAGHSTGESISLEDASRRKKLSGLKNLKNSFSRSSIILVAEMLKQQEKEIQTAYDIFPTEAAHCTAVVENFRNDFQFYYVEDFNKIDNLVVTQLIQEVKNLVNLSFIVERNF